MGGCGRWSGLRRVTIGATSTNRPWYLVLVPSRGDTEEETALRNVIEGGHLHREEDRVVHSRIARSSPDLQLRGHGGRSPEPYKWVEKIPIHLVAFLSRDVTPAEGKVCALSQEQGLQAGALHGASQIAKSVSRSDFGASRDDLITARARALSLRHILLHGLTRCRPDDRVSGCQRLNALGSDPSSRVSGPRTPSRTRGRLLSFGPPTISSGAYR